MVQPSRLPPLMSAASLVPAAVEQPQVMTGPDLARGSSALEGRGHAPHFNAESPQATHGSPVSCHSLPWFETHDLLGVHADDRLTRHATSRSCTPR